MELNEPKNDLQFIEECLLQDNNRLKLIIYRRILYGRRIIPICLELDELIEHGLIIEYNNIYKVYNKIYQKHFTIDWTEQKLITDNIKNQILVYTQNDLYLKKILIEVCLNHPYSYTSNNSEQIDWLESLIRNYIINNWHTAIHQDNNEEAYLRNIKQEIYKYLKEIEQKILSSKNVKQLLIYYQNILQNANNINDDRNQIFQELIKLNLIVVNDDLRLEPHSIYRDIFNKQWVHDKLLQSIKDPNQEIFNPHRFRRVKLFLIITLTILGVSSALMLIFLKINIDIPFEEEIALEALNELAAANIHEAQALSLKSLFELKQSIETNSSNDLSKYSSVTPILVSGKLKDNIYVKDLIAENIASIRAVAFNSDGKKIAVGGEKGQLLIYTFSDKNLGEVFVPPVQFKKNKITVSSLGFHPNKDNNKQFLVVAQKNSVKLFKVYEDKLELVDEHPASEEGHTEEIYDIQFNRTGEYLFTLDHHKNFKLWNFDINAEELSSSNFLEKKVNVKSAAFSPKSNLLVIATNEKIILYNLESKEMLIDKEIFGIELTSISFSHDGKYLATTENNKVFIRDLNLERYKCFIDNNKCLDNIKKAYFTPWRTLGNYSMIAKQKDKKRMLAIILENQPNKNNDDYYSIKKINKHKNWNVETFDFDPNQEQYMITGERNQELNKVLFWDLHNLVYKEKNTINLGKKNNLKLNDIFINRLIDYTARLITINQDGNYKIQDFESKIDKTTNLNKVFSNFPSSIIALTILRDPDLSDRDQLAVISQSQNQDKYLLLCNFLENRCKDNNKYDLSSLGKIKTIKNNYKNNRIVIIDNQDRGYFLNLDNSYIETRDNIKDVDISFDGNTIVSVTSDNKSFLYDWKDNSIDLNRFLASDVEKVTFSSQGKYLALNYNDKLEIRVNSLEDKYSIISKGLSKDLLNVSDFVFSPDEEYIAIINNGRDVVQIKKLHNSDDNYSKLTKLKIDKNSKVGKLVFSPKLTINVYGKEIKANLIAIADSYGKISLWDLQGKLISEFESGKDNINVIDLQFSPKQKLQNTNGENQEVVKYLMAVFEEKGEQGEVHGRIWDITEELNLEKIISRECEWYDPDFLQIEFKKKYKLSKLGSKCKQAKLK